MFFDQRTSQQLAVSLRGSRCFALFLLLAGVFLTGCGEMVRPQAEVPEANEVTHADQWSGQVLQAAANPPTNPPTSIPSEQFSDSLLIALPPIEEEEPNDIKVRNSALDISKEENPYWSFPTDTDVSLSQIPPELIRLPSVDKSLVEELVEKMPQMEVDPPEQLPIATLLPPQLLPEPTVNTIPEPKIASPEPKVTSQVDELKPKAVAPAVENLAINEMQSQPLPAIDESLLPEMDGLNNQEKLLALQLQDASSAATGVLTDKRINTLAKKKIQHAYAMANRGAMYVARQELIEVLRLLSQEKDAQIGSPDRTVALAAGLRALSEAEDFAPQGTQLEAELDIRVLCASHRTPVSKQAENANLLPRLMLDRYLRYAQLQLAMSVAGEPAGSMALHALGKLNTQLGRQEPDKHRLSQRHAIAFQQAALLAHDRNYLAAHELGVLLASSGHFAEAEQLLLQVARREPNAVVFRNLSIVQQELGQQTQSQASQDYALRLTQQGATGTHNVQWISPQQFTRTGVTTRRYTTAQRSAAGPPPIPGSREAVPANMRR